MNTLGKQTTQQFFNRETGYTELQGFWCEQIKNGFKPTTYDLLSYAVIRGKDYRKGFTPISNKVRLDNGQVPLAAMRDAIYKLRHRGFSPVIGVFINPDSAELIKRLIPQVEWELKELPDSAYKEVVSV